MNQLACDVNLTEQAELWRLEGGISWSDERVNATLVPGFTDEFADFLAADAEFEITASTSDVLLKSARPPLSIPLTRTLFLSETSRYLQVNGSAKRSKQPARVGKDNSSKNRDGRRLDVGQHDGQSKEPESAMKPGRR